jgi:type I restriction enzyme S subunit
MIRYLRAANVKDGRLELDDVMEMNFTPREQGTFGLREGDVLITEGAGSLNAVGANAPWAGELDGPICFQNTLIRLRPKRETDPSYVAWWARYAYESGLLRAAATGANIYHLGVETVRALPAWAPSAATQRDVAQRLDREVGLIEAQSELRRRQIDLLLERRQALITAAVTGQLEIPGVAA